MLKKIFSGYILLWVFAIGWVANVVQFFQQMPAVIGEATPFWIVKGICIFLAPVGSVLGWLGMF